MSEQRQKPTVLEAHEAEKSELRREIVKLESIIARRDLTIAKLKGEKAEVERCPCNSPADHAGWCPRKGD